jgi:stage V sporulation protein T
MKATGCVRRIDDLGRVVIPKEIRRTLNIKDGDALELFIEPKQNMVCFKKYQPDENPIDNLKQVADTFGELGMFEKEKQVRELIFKLEQSIKE